MVGIWALPLRAGELQASLDARSCGLLRTLRIPNADDHSCTAGLCPGPRDFLQAWARIEVAGYRIGVGDLAGNCGLWCCQTAGQNLQVMFNRHQWLKKNRPACSVAGPPNHAGLKRHSDASARVSLTGCVPAEPASVSPRSARMPQLQHSVTTA